jgi:hypothetical protein
MKARSLKTMNKIFEHTLKLKNTIFWDITPCSPLKVNRRFGGTYRLNLQGRKISRARNQRESGWQGEHGVISQKIVLFITTSVRTSNPTEFKVFYSGVTRCLKLLFWTSSIGTVH